MTENAENNPYKIARLESYSKVYDSGNRFLFVKKSGNFNRWISIIFNLKYPIIKSYITYGNLNLVFGKQKAIVELINEKTNFCPDENVYEDVLLKEKIHENISLKQFYELIGYGTVKCQKQSIRNKYYITKLPSNFFSRVAKEMSKQINDEISLYDIFRTACILIDSEDVNSRYEKYVLFYNIVDSYLNNSDNV